MSIYQFLCYALINANTHTNIHVHICAYTCQQYLLSGAVPQYFYHAVYVSGLYHTFPHFSRRLSNKYSLSKLSSTFVCAHHHPRSLSLSLSRYVAHPALLSAFTSDLKRAGGAVHSLATRSIIAHSPACHILTYISTCIYIFLFVCLFIRVVSFICSLAQSFRYFY